MTVQLDMFDTIQPVKVFDWANETNCKIFQYSDDLQFDDIALENHYVLDVPMYRYQDVCKALGVTPDGKSDYWTIVRNKKFNNCIVRITDRDRYGAGNKWYVLATPKFQKYIKRKALFAIIKNDTNKMPRLYKKVVHIRDINYRKDLKNNFVQAYTLSKWHTQHILSQLDK